MEFMKHKLGILVLFLCVGIIIAAIWYCMFALPEKNSVPDGTFVEHCNPDMVMTKL